VARVLKIVEKTIYIADLLRTGTFIHGDNFNNFGKATFLFYVEQLKLHCDKFTTKARPVFLSEYLTYAHET
jgi:hypothetical protein